MHKIHFWLMLCCAQPAFAQDDIFTAIYSYDTLTVKKYVSEGGDLMATDRRLVDLSTRKLTMTILDVSLYDAALLSVRLGNESKNPDRIVSAYRNFQVLADEFHRVPDKQPVLDKMLGVAVSTGDVSLVRWVVENGANLNKVCEVCYGRTPTLIAVAYNANLEMIKFLLSQKPDLSIKDYDGRGYLHYAARNGNLVLLDYLLELGVEDINITDNMNITPVFDAVLGNQLETYNYLLGKGARTDIVSIKDDNLLYYALMNDNLDFFRQVYFTSGLDVPLSYARKVTSNTWILQFLAAEHLKKGLED